MRTRHSGVRTAAAVLVATALGTAACSGGNEVADITVVAPTVAAPTVAAPTVAVSTVAASDAPDTLATTPPGTSPETTPSTSPAASVSTPATTATLSTSAVDGLSGPTFSDALGVRVDTAPGVRTRGDTRRLLDEGLYVHIAWEADPDDASVFTVQQEDIEILEAYANAAAAYYRVAQSSLDPSDPELTQLYVDPDDMFGRTFDQAQAGSYRLDLGAGVLLRPYVVDRGPDSATVYDCYLQDELFIVSGEQRQHGVPLPKGQVLTLALRGGRWLVDTAGPMGSACL